MIAVVQFPSNSKDDPMFDKKHYVPILKTKEGEIWALKNLRSVFRPKMTPLLELHKPPKRKDQPPKPLGDHIQEVCESIRKAWGTSNPFFLDTEWVNKMHGPAEAITRSFNACRAHGLKAIPVVKINYDEQSLEAIKSAIEADQRGCMLRLDFEDVNAHVAIQGVLEYAGLQKSKTHFLLDYREHAMNLTDDIPKVMSIDEWATLTTSSGTFPKTISTLPQKIWIDAPRHDWNTWKQSSVGGDLTRSPTFSDYATRCPGAPAAGGDPHVHLRYTTDNKWIVYLDGTLQSGDAKNMPSICRELVPRSEYCGREFSEGDKEIHCIAFQGDAIKEKTGGSTQWVQWCVNHHLTFVVNQLKPNIGL